MVMDIINQRDREQLADRQQIPDRIADVIVFQCQTAFDIIGQPGKDLAKSLQRCRFVPINPAGVNINDVGTNRLRQRA
jgi:hypothetical protein